jgi:hypothetical protein
MKIRYLKDANGFGAGTVAEHDEPTCNALISQGIAETVPEGTKSRKYPPTAKVENFCVPPLPTTTAGTSAVSITYTPGKSGTFTKNKR